MEKNALPHKEDTATRSKCTPVIIELRKAVGLNRTYLNIIYMPQRFLCL